MSAGSHTDRDWNPRLPLLAIALPLLILVLRPLLLGQIWFHEDLEFYFVGLRGQLHTFFLTGSVFGWNPFVAGGTPLLADIQLAPFYPLNLPFYVLPPGPAFGLSFLIHFALGSWLCWQFLRDLELSLWPAAFGTLVWMWGGFFWAHLHHVTFLAAGIWLPGMLWTWELHRRGTLPGWRSWGPLAGMVGMSALAGGSPQILYYALLALGALMAVTSWSTDAAVRFRKLGWAAVAVAVGLALGAIQLWPFYLATLEKFPQVLPPLDYSTSFSLSPLSIGRMLVPNMLGNDFYPLEGRGYVGPTAYWENWCYVGILTLPLVALAAGWQRPQRRFYVGLFWASLVGSFGVLGGLHVILVELVPLYDRFRAPSRLFILTTLAAAVLGAMGLERSLTLGAGRMGPAPALRQERLLRTAKYTLVLGIELWLLVALSLFLREKPLHLVATTGWVLALLNLLLAWCWLRLAARGRWRGHALSRHILGGLAVGVLLLDLLPVLWTYNHTRPAEVASREPAVVSQLLALIQEGERVLTDRSAPHWLINAGTEFGYRNVRGYNPLNSARMVAFLQASDNAGRSEGGISALVRNPLSPMLELLAARWHVTSKSRPSGRFVERYRDPKDRIRIYEDLNALPRAWVTDRVWVEPDAEAVLTRTRAVSRQRPVPLVLEAGGPPLVLNAGSAQTATIRWLEDGRDEVVLEVSTKGAVALVLADTYAAGWSVALNGTPVPLLAAYHALRAVILSEAGTHHIRFFYQTPGLTAGAMITGAAGLLLLAGLLARRLGR